MSTSEVFNHSYQVTGTVGGQMTIVTSFGGTSPYTLSDGADGANNGTTAVDAGINFSDTNQPYSGVQFAGLTEDGDPIIRFQSGSTFILSNNTDLPVNSGIGTSTASSYAYCFAEGTGVATPGGIKRVEQLVIGNTVCTADGLQVPVRWIGRQTISTRFGPAARLMPVRVRAGALGEGLPLSDLVLTADHALLMDGLLINAGALVNGTTIDYVPLSELGDSYTVYHIETENHDVILAEGTPAETYIDYVARRAFDNYDEYVALYGEDRAVPEMPVPRISSQRQLPPTLATRLGITRAA